MRITIPILCCSLAVTSTGEAQTRAMLVHLPEAPIESMSQLGDGVTQLAAYIQERVPGLALEVKAFRKTEDALAHIQSDGANVALVLCDVAFLSNLSNLPGGFDVTPSFRLIRDGKETRRKLVVVKTSSGLRSLADLHGRSITVVQAAGAGADALLRHGIFRDEIDPGAWFGTIARETDDFTATAAVLYDRTDAALVSEDNPLLTTHLSKDLTEIYASGAVSMPVVAAQSSVLDAAQMTALGDALQQLGSSSEASQIRTVLKIDGLRRLDAGTPLYASASDEPGPERALEVSVPSLPVLGFSELPAIDPDGVPYLVGVELADVPIPQELVDSVLSNQTETQGRPGR